MDTIQSKQTVSNNPDFLSESFQQRFLHGIQHEIRTPFVGLTGLTQCLRDTEKDPERKELLNTAVQSGNRLLNFLNQLIQYAQCAQGSKQNRKEIFKEVDLRGLLYDLQLSLNPTLQQKQIDFHYVVHDEVPPLLYGDADTIQQALFYLLSGFVNYLKRGAINIQCQKIKKTKNRIKVAISCHLSGFSLSTEQAKHIFEPFFDAKALCEHRVDQKPNPFNLAMVESFIKKLGGKIELIPELNLASSEKKHEASSQTPQHWVCCCEFSLNLKPM